MTEMMTVVSGSRGMIYVNSIKHSLSINNCFGIQKRELDRTCTILHKNKNYVFVIYDSLQLVVKHGAEANNQMEVLSI
jgi:hypothetical protein